MRELGLEPSAELRRMQHLILMAGPEAALDQTTNGSRERLVRSN
jgi:hypothetical protein